MRDDWQRELRLERLPARIVSLAPHATEILFEAGAGAQVIAVDPNSDHPPAAAGLPKVAAYPSPDPERLLALAPDLVVLWGAGASRESVASLERFGLRVFVTQPRRLSDVASTLERFAAFSANPDAALAAATVFRARLAALERRAKGLPRTKVFVQVWADPTITVGDRDAIGDAVRACGGVNVFANLPGAAPRVDAEAVLAARPALVVATDSPASRERWERAGLLAPRGPARFAHVDGRVLERPSPRVLDAVARLCDAIDAARPAPR